MKLIFLTIFLLNNLLAQADYRFQRFSSADGLAENVVHKIFKDSRGFLWFGTDGGLNRFDGLNFKLYKRDYKKKNTLSSFQILDIYENGNGTFWIGTGNGLNLFNPSDESFQSFYVTDSDLASEKTITAIHPVNDSLLLLGTFSLGLFFNVKNYSFEKINLQSENIPSFIHQIGKLKNGEILITAANGLFLFDERTNSFSLKSSQFNFEPLKNKPVWRFIETVNNELLVTVAGGFYVFSEKEKNGKFISLKKSVGENVFQVPALAVDHSGNVWFGTNKGLIFFNLQTSESHIIKNDPFDNHSLSSNNINHLLFDQHIMWIATFGGGLSKLNLFNRGFKNFKTQRNDKDGLALRFIMNIYEDGGELLFNSLNDGFAIFNKSTKKFSYFDPLKTETNSSAARIHYSPFKVSADKYFLPFGNRLNIFKKSGNRFEKLKTLEGDYFFYHLIKDSEGYFWGVNYFSIVRFKFAEQLSEIYDLKFFPFGSPINYLYDSGDFIWAAASNLGLISLNKKNFTIKKYFPNNFSDTENPITFYFIHQGRKGELWLGSFGEGLFRFKISTSQFKKFTQEDGLADNTIYSILEDDSTNLWLGTNRGITKFDRVKNIFFNYSKLDGLMNEEFNRKSCLKSSDGTFYFGGVNGVDFFRPNEIKNDDSSANIFITRFRVSGIDLESTEEISFMKSVELRYDQNYFTINFASLNFAFPESAKYKFILEGVDLDWNYVEAIGTANYTHVSPGEYIFKVFAANNDGVWSENGTQLEIIIAPPFWGTIWFKTLAFLSVFFIIGTVIFQRNSRLKREKILKQEFAFDLIRSVEDERKRIARELHDGIGQNVLIIKNKAFTARQSEDLDFVKKESKSIETLSLDTINELREILYDLRPYQLDRFGITDAIKSVLLSIQQESKFKIDFAIDDIDGVIKKENEIFLFRIIQEALNNILKHSSANEVKIFIVRTNNRIETTIEDNGIGFDEKEVYLKSGKNMGLRTIKERTDYLGGKIEIKTAPNSGTKIKLILNSDYD